MPLFFCCLYLLLMVGLGYFLFSLIHVSGRVSVVQLLGLVPALGAGALGLLLFWLSLLGLAPSRPLLSILGAVTFAGLLVLAKFRRLARLTVAATWTPKDGWLIFPGLVITLVLVLLAAGNLAVPLVDWDAFAIWGLKAKVLHHEALRPVPAYFQDQTLRYSHLDYPLLVPFLTAGAYAALGQVDDQLGKMVSVFLDALIVPVIYLGLRWKLSRRRSAGLCALLVLLPAFLRFGGVGCADLPLTLFYAGSIIFVARWVDRQQWEDLVLVILFSAFAAFTKVEGSVLALINGLGLLGFAIYFRRRTAWVGTSVFFAGLLVLHAPWFFWSRALPHTHENFVAQLLSADAAASLPRLNQVFWAMLLQITNVSVWGGLWILTGGMAVLGGRAFRRPPVLVLWCLLGAHLLTYGLVFSFTPWNLTMLLATSLDRLLWHTIPAVVLLAGWHWAEVAHPRVEN